MDLGSDTDRICLRGITARGFHGVLDAERSLGQPFVVDLTVHADLARAGRSDDLADTVNYDRLANLVVDAITGQPLDLVEALAERIADVVLREPGIQRTEVTVHKPHAPVTVPVADVAITISRGRAGRGESSPGRPVPAADDTAKIREFRSQET